MVNKRFFFVLSVIISTTILLGLTLEVSSLDLNSSNVNQSNNAMESNEIENVIEEVLSYVSMHRPDDPMIEVEPHIFVKKSNVEGIEIDGKTYYYSLFPHASFDPVAIGKISRDKITVLYNDEKSTIPVIIYNNTHK